MSKFRTFIFEEIEPCVGLVTLNRPDKLNAINVSMLDDFNELFAALTKDDAIRVLIITGAGRGFCAGADLNDALSYKDSEALSDPEKYLRLAQERYAALVLGLRRIPQPVISAVNGPAAGGGFAMALASDIRMASPEAYFVASFANIGLSAGEMGTSYLLPRLIGLARAADILYTGRKVNAEEAERMGLVNRVVPKEALLETALSFARLMTAKGVGALKLTKRVLDQNIDAPSLEAAVNLENRNQTIMIFSGEFFKLIKPFFKGVWEVRIKDAPKYPEMRIVYYEKPYDDDAVIIDLANAHSLKGIPGINLSDAIKSRRAFLNQSVSLEELSFLLWATQRNTPGNIQGPAKGIFAGN